MYRRMSSTVFYAVVLLACALKFSSSQTSCKGRCGAEYYRGYMCQCDFTCLAYGECCSDFESQCTTKNSCLGRCGEAFKRGRLCSCDPDCVKYKQCCPDFKLHCDAEDTVVDAVDQPSTFSEGNDADDYVVPLDGPTESPTDELGMNSKISPVDDFSNNGVEELEASPIPESTSGYGSTPADLLVQGSTEPTLVTDTMEFTTEAVTVFSQTEMIPSDDADLTAGEAPTESTDANDFTSSPDLGTALPEPTAAADDDSSQPSSTSEPSTSTSVPELGTEGPSEILPADEIFPSEEPALTAVPPSTEDSTTIPDSTAAPEETTPNPDADVPTGPPSAQVDVEDDSTGVSPQGSELDVEATDLPSSTDDVTPDITTADPLKVTSEPTTPQTSEPTSEPTTPQTSEPTSEPTTPQTSEPTSEPTTPQTSEPTSEPTTPQTSEPTSKPQDKPDPYKPLPAKPASKPETKPLDVEQTSNMDDTRGYQGDDSNDTNLCSGRPVGAVTTLRNGTTVVFRGHYFWYLDRNRVPGPAQGITQVWGVPSPVDTVFTRCNCQGKTYIFKGNQYWRFENDALDVGYPKAVSTGFDGLRGHITAALSVPQHRSRRESVYFFKRGGYVQKYSYQFGTSPTCSRKPQYAIYTVRNRVARQAVSVLEPAINIRTSWRGFPSTITAAVSIPNNQEPEGYKYYVISRTKTYNVRMSGERPVLAAPKANAPPQANDVFKCPKKV